MPKLREVTRSVRSKNAGPFWVTVDIFFDGAESYRRYRNDPALGAAALAGLLGADPTLARRFEIETLNAIKLSYPRALPQGGVVERDLHAGQQYVPLLDIELMPATEIQYSSPACAIREADDVYMGYAGRDELVEALSRLLMTVSDEPWRPVLARHLAVLQGDAPADVAPLAGDEAPELLRRLLPRVRDDALHADLSALLGCYEGG